MTDPDPASGELEAFIRHASEVVLETPIFDVRRDLAEHPRSGRRGHYYVLEQPDWVNVVAETTQGELVVIRQWRHGTRRVELEIPAGLIDPGETPLQAAARELREETGYVAEALELIGSVAPNPAFSANTCHTVLARGCRLAGAQELDAGEDIAVDRITPDELRAAIRDGRVRNAMVICGLYWWLDR